MAARLQRGLSGLGAAASSAATSLNNPGSNTATATSREISLPPPPQVQEDGDSLPDYSRADPRLSKALEATSMREHVYSKKAIEMTCVIASTRAPGAYMLSTEYEDVEKKHLIHSSFKILAQKSPARLH